MEGPIDGIADRKAHLLGVGHRIIQGIIPGAGHTEAIARAHIEGLRWGIFEDRRLSPIIVIGEQTPSIAGPVIVFEGVIGAQAVSVAKALGLTQVTPLAHQEIKKFKSNWEIYPNFSALTYSDIKSKLSTEKITPYNDWRLDPQKSIEGGIVYLQYLENYWNTPDKQKILEQSFASNIPRTDIILASYNSGAARVKQSILKNDKDWLFDKSLNEARNYVMNIKSYCYAFSKEKQQ